MLPPTSTYRVQVQKGKVSNMEFKKEEEKESWSLYICLCTSIKTKVPKNVLLAMP